jgi:hypothetical protein
MEETKTSEQASSESESEKSQSVLPDEWIQRWQQLETQIRERPGPYLLGALAAGYLLQTIPCRTLLVFIGKLCLRLIKPILFLAGAVKLAQYSYKNAKDKF